MRRIFPLLLWTGLGLMPWAAHADVWGYVDAEGMSHFADRKVDSRYQLYFKSEHFRFDAQKALAAGRGEGRMRVAARSGGTVRGSTLLSGNGLAFNPQADAAAGVKARRLTALINQSSAYRAVAHHMAREARRNAVDVDLLKSVIAAESGFNRQAVSGAGAVGLMQIMPATARDLGVQADAAGSVEHKLTDPALNVRLGARYLRQLLDRFHGRVDLAVAAYNAGHGAVSRAGNAVPRYAETQNYVRTVMALYQTFRPGAEGMGVPMASVAPIPLGRLAGRGRVNMTLASARSGKAPSARAMRLEAAALESAQRSLTAEATGTEAPSAMDQIAGQVAAADRMPQAPMQLGADVVVRSGAPSAHATPDSAAGSSAPNP